MNEADQAVILEALQATKRLIDEALPKFNWGASALDANAIRLLNETPKKVELALSVFEDESSQIFARTPVTCLGRRFRCTRDP